MTRPFTFPGEFARRLYVQHGADRSSWSPPLNIDAWAVVNDKIERVTIEHIRSATGCGTSADYVDCAGGRTLATFYLWPVAKHCKPRLTWIQDEYGKTRQWVAPLKKRCLSAW